MHFGQHQSHSRILPKNLAYETLFEELHTHTHTTMNDERQEKLLGTIWQSVQEIVKQETEELGKTATPAFTASLAEILYSQMVTMANDLESFASHGKRSVISMEDVKLCARRNDSLHEIITVAAKEITEDMMSNKRKKN